MRRSREATAESRARILAEAGRLVRERGIDGVSVADVMKAAGLTHGGFYVHFPSKGALVAAAAAAAFDEPLRSLEEPQDEALAAYVGRYVAAGHARELGRSCPIAGFAPDAAREGGDLAKAVAAGAERTLDALAAHMGGDRPEAIRLLALMLGGLVLARALGDEQAEEMVFDAVREARPVAQALKEAPRQS